jgi:hypothetical protein
MINIIEVLVLLYNTENNFDTEEIDCIYHTQESTGKYFKQFDILLLTSRHPNNSLNRKSANLPNCSRVGEFSRRVQVINN